MSGVAQDETTPTGKRDDDSAAFAAVPGAAIPSADIRDPTEGSAGLDIESARMRAHLRLVADNSDARSAGSGEAETVRMEPTESAFEHHGLRSGAWLRATRENQGFSLEQVSRETRIRQDHLRAIEDMMPNLVGAKVYVEGHIRTYARHLGLPVEEVLSQYRRECAILSDPEKSEIAPPVTQRKLRASAPMLGLLAVALAGAGAVAVVMNLPKGESANAAQATEDLGAPAAAPAVTAPPLRIVALRAARIEIRGADGTKFIGREFQPGETYAPRVGAGWTVSTEQGDAFEWRLGDTVTLGLFAPQGGPVNYQSVDMALQRQPVTISSASAPVTTPSPLDANATVTTPGAAPAPRRSAPRPAAEESAAMPVMGPAPANAPTAVNDPALAAYPDARPEATTEPAVPPSAQ